MSKKIFYLFLVLILLLVVFNLRLNYLSNSFDEACTNDYSGYLNNGTCPCTPVVGIDNRLFINSTESFIINMSIDK